MSPLEQRYRGGCCLLPVGLALCLAAGVAVGLVISWWLWPVEYTDVSPDSLRPAHRLEYIGLIAQAYAYDQDLRRAQIRLAALGDLAEMGLEVANLAEQQAAEGTADISRVRALATLAYALGHRRSALAAYLPGGAPTATWTPWPTATGTSEPATATATLPPATATATLSATPTSSPTPSPTQVTQSTTTPIPVPTQTRTVRPSATPSRTPTHTATSTPTPTRPLPTLTPTVTLTPEPRYELVEQRRVCPGVDEPVERGGELQVTVLDARGEPQPNVELLIRWGADEDRALTGLKPEKGAGYADFRLSLGESYQVGVIGIGSEVAQGIVADDCVGSDAIASWVVVFQLSDGASFE